MTSKNLALALLAGVTIASGALGLSTASADRAKPSRAAASKAAAASAAASKAAAASAAASKAAAASAVPSSAAASKAAAASAAPSKAAPAIVWHGKPTAPVTLTAVAERTAMGWQVVVDATPTVGVDRVRVEIDGKPSRFGKTAAARARRVVVPVEVAAGTGKDVIVAARVAGRSTAVIVRVGAPAPEVAAPAVTVRVVNGITIAEVRQ